MEFVTTAGVLHHVLATAMRATPRNGSIIAWTGVQLNVLADTNELVAIGSDGETTITARGDVDVRTAGQSLIVPKPIADLTNKLPAELTIVVRRNEIGDLDIGPEGGTPYRFRELTATFPARPGNNDGLQQADLSALGEALAAVRVSVAKDGACLVQSDGTDLVLSTTDSYRLSVVRLPNAAFGDHQLVVPISALEEIARHDMNHIGLDATGKNLRAAGAKVSISARLADSKFPPIAGPVGTPSIHTVEIDPDPMLGALDRLQTVADDKPVQLTLEGDRATLTVDNIEIGYGSETVTLQSRVLTPFTCLLSRGYLADALRSHHTDTVHFGYTGPLDAVKITSQGRFGVLSLLMPVRV